VVVRLTSLADAVVAARALSPESGRVLLGLVGVPGSGKSTVAEALVTALGPASVVVPMDGFHLPNDVLVVRAAPVELRQRSDQLDDDNGIDHRPVIAT